MSHLRAPVARPERREGGRHGRPDPRSFPSAPGPDAATPQDARIRPRPLRAELVRTAVLPATVASLSGAAAVVLVLRSTTAEPTAPVWTALFGTALLAFSAIAAAALGAERTARTVFGRCNALRRASARRQAELSAVVEQLRQGERVPARPAPPAGTGHGGDEFDLLAAELGRSHESAVGAVIQASRLSSSVGNEQKVEVFVNLARRLQSLVHREIQLLDDLENEVEDPELLKGLFQVDHLATRIRRHAENLAVLGGAISRRQWSRPVTLTEVLRSAIAEVEQYPRVKLVPPIEGTLRGHAVADVIHLLAELVENATLFSSPHTQVLLRAQQVTAGLAIEVEDRGLGMHLTEQKKMNALLTDPDQVNVAHLLQDGRIGLFVVSALARRHGIAVRIQTNIYGGIQAVLVLPRTLLGSDPAEHPEQEGQSAPQAAPQPAPQAPVREEGPPPAAGSPVPGSPAQGPAAPGAPAPGSPGAPAPAGPAPLPVRSARAERPTPAAARPGARHAGRPEQPPAPVIPVRPAVVPTGDGMIRGTASRPQLPRRRGQEHLVPQLRDAPAPAPAGEPALHDPGLMAAFRRGIGLAEAQPAARPTGAAPLSPEPPESPRHDTTPKE
ncbi:ATP-binding protein [Streptomyces sp. JV176]|uniref:sensor histidine kinase n=1 Tax=Streptomyces sp. JV176 TaxID=858630 RepID=UPI002E7A1EA9|nr:ATP-binding protein [Streptomyces sp. JV176]MEE1802997.1 ATP-binding protein [Streptomyces sp. JV176]